MYDKTSGMRQLNTVAIVRLDSRSDKEQIFRSVASESTQGSPPNTETMQPSISFRPQRRYQGVML